MHCPCTNINIPRFLAMSVAGYAFVFGFEYLIHHKLLMGLYTQTEALWRPTETMGEYYPLMIARGVLLVVILGFIFTRNYEGKGISEGLRFGAAIGVLLALLMSSSYIWMPIPLDLALGWAASGLGTGLGLGVIYSLIYRK